MLLKAITPAGTFTRTTERTYSHVCVRVPVEGAEAFVAANAGYKYKTGCFARYLKDRGHVVSWHGSEAAARKEAAKGTKRFYIRTDVLGVFPVATGA